MPAFLSISGKWSSLTLARVLAQQRKGGCGIVGDAGPLVIPNSTAGRRQPFADISQKARELTVGKTDFDGKARALASFLQTEVFAMWRSRSASADTNLTPRATFFHARYGDCKDKATLLSSPAAGSGDPLRIRPDQYESRYC